MNGIRSSAQGAALCAASRIARRAAFCAALWCIVAGGSQAQEIASSADERLERGIAAHEAAAAGKAASLEEALRLLGPEGWDRPPLAFAYHGSALTLAASQAKKAGDLLKALARIDEGVKEIDEALRLDPMNIEIRFLRMENALALSEESPVDRKALAATDADYLRTRWAELKAEDRALVELDQGRLALAERRSGEAMASWRRAIREAPGSGAALRAKKLIARYGD
jgi:tetratricopeptide (TPR) repeat protein